MEYIIMTEPLRNSPELRSLKDESQDLYEEDDYLIHESADMDTDIASPQKTPQPEYSKG